MTAIQKLMLDNLLGLERSFNDSDTVFLEDLNKTRNAVLWPAQNERLEILAWECL